MANSVRDINTDESKGVGYPLTSRLIMIIATALQVPFHSTEGRGQRLDAQMDAGDKSYPSGVHTGTSAL